MYTEYERRGFPLGSFLLKLIIVIVLVFLLLWLLPKFLKPVVNRTYNESRTATSEKSSSKDNKKNSKDSNCSSSSNCDLSGLDALTSQIFIDNIYRMKDAAISYYTDERLPKNVGEFKEMTLSDMIGEKIIIALIDKNNKACDVEKSYVRITKLDDEYVLKVNLKDSEKEDYILVHLGCYTYCDSYLCQKSTAGGSKTKNIPIKGANFDDGIVPIKGSYQDGEYVEPENPTVVVTEKHYCVKYNGKYYGINGKVVSKAKYEEQCVKKEEEHYCVKYNGKYYGIDGDIVSKTKYEEQCGKKEEKHYCVKFNGEYYDSEGNKVSKEQYEKDCGNPSKDEKHYCVRFNGEYYDSEGNKVSKEQYEKDCGEPQREEKHYCAIVDGKYYGLNGEIVSEKKYNEECLGIVEKHICQKYNGKYYGRDGSVVSYDEYKAQCEKKREYIYEYKKVTQASFSQWTAWSNWSKTDCSTGTINCSDTDINCLMKRQRYDRKEKIGTYQKEYARTRTEQRYLGSYTTKACSKYNYVEINRITYATTTTTTYTAINYISSSSAGWRYNGRASYNNPPRDSGSTHYKFVGADYSYCAETCTTLPNYYYDSYTYTGGLSQVPNTYSTPEEIVSNVTIPVASCGEYVYKEVPIYGSVEVTDKDYRTEPLYGTVCYQSTKTRQLLFAGSTEYKWSTYHDTVLESQGWIMTGESRLK